MKKNKKLIELYGFVKSVNVSYNMVFKADKNASYIMIYPSWRITRKGKIIQSSDVYPFHSNFQEGEDDEESQEFYKWCAITDSFRNTRVEKIKINENGDIEFEWKDNIKLQAFIFDYLDYSYYFYHIKEKLMYEMWFGECDPNAKLIADPDHSEEEDRFIILGISNNSKVLVVCHCYREKDEVIRIISARKATTNERNSMEKIKMREEYDFSNAVKNPYVGKLKQQITIRLDEQVIDYFKKMSEETGMPYQNIINYYLLECVKEKKHMEVAFAK